MLKMLQPHCSNCGTDYSLTKAFREAWAVCISSRKSASRGLARTAHPTAYRPPRTRDARRLRGPRRASRDTCARSARHLSLVSGQRHGTYAPSAPVRRRENGIVRDTERHTSDTPHDYTVSASLDSRERCETERGLYRVCVRKSKLSSNETTARLCYKVQTEFYQTEY